MSSVNSELIKYLSGFVTPARWQNMERIIGFRTRHITVALEDLFQPHNASAVLRTCECLGIQDVHIIENKNQYKINPDVVMGSDKWINLIIYNGESSNSNSAINNLRKNGYRIVATSLSKKATTLDRFDIADSRCAIFFGTELTGLTEEVLDQADENLKIPIYGFTDSYNISVSAAIILHDLLNRLRKSEIPWQLTDPEKEEVLFQWLKNSIKRSELLIEEFLRTR
jgi:tRNA (guanosine-2'-O-)-methyltransferase